MLRRRLALLLPPLLHLRRSSPSSPARALWSPSSYLASLGMTGVGQMMQQHIQQQQQQQQQQRQAHFASLASRLRALADEAQQQAAAASSPSPSTSSAAGALSALSAQLRALAEQQHQQEDPSDAVRQRLERLVHGQAAAEREQQGRDGADAAGDADADAAGGDDAAARAKRQRKSQAQGAAGKKSRGAARQYDARKYGARRVLLEIAYLGERYRGFARQTPSEAKRAAAAAASGQGAAAGAAAARPATSRSGTNGNSGSGDNDGTVEGALFSALRRVCLVPPGADPVRALGYSRCGRTDRGVSALGQVVALTLRSAGPPPPPPSLAAAAPGDDDEAAADATPATTTTALLDAATSPLPLTPPHLLPPPDQEIDYAAMLNRALPPDVRVLGWADPPELLLAPPPPPQPAAGEEEEEGHPTPAAPPAAAEFDARFSASYREYLYFFTSPHLPGPGAFDLAAGGGNSNGGGGGGGSNGGSAASAGATAASAVGAPCLLDVRAMDEAARFLEGEHDFRSFCKVDASGHVKHFVRRVISARVVPAGAAYAPAFACDGSGRGGRGGKQKGDGDAAAPAAAAASDYHPHQTFALRIRGTAFLYHQVRCIAAVLLMVGRGLERPGVVRELLDVRARPRKPQYALAPEQPLLLYACGYGDEEDEEEDEEGDEDREEQEDGGNARGRGGGGGGAGRPAGPPRPLACGRIRWHRSARAVQAAEASLGAVLQSHLVGAAMAGAMLERVRRDAARARRRGASEESEEEEEEEDASAAAAAAARRQHVPLLERATEPSLDERFRALGIPTDGLDLLEQRRTQAEKAKVGVIAEQ